MYCTIQVVEGTAARLCWNERHPALLRTPGRLPFLFLLFLLFYYLIFIILLFNFYYFIII